MTLPQLQQQYLLSSTLNAQQNDVLVTYFFDAMVGVWPGLRKWQAALTVEADLWEPRHIDEGVGFLTFLSSPCDNRHSLEQTLADIYAEVVRRAAATSFRHGNEAQPVLLDVALVFEVSQWTGGTRRNKAVELMRRLRKAFGLLATEPSRSFYDLSLRTVSASMRSRGTAVFPTADDMVMRVATAASVDVVDATEIEEAEEAAVPDQQMAASDGEGEEGVADLGASAPDDDDDVQEAAHILSHLVPPGLLCERLVNPRHTLRDGYRVEDLMRWATGRRTTLFSHGTLPGAARVLRRSGLHDPVLRGYGRMGVPPGCAAICLAPVLNIEYIFFCALLLSTRAYASRGRSQGLSSLCYSKLRWITCTARSIFLLVGTHGVRTLATWTAPHGLC